MKKQYSFTLAIFVSILLVIFLNKTTNAQWEVNTDGSIHIKKNVGINTAAHPDYSLAVNGKIKAKEVNVTLTGYQPLPDYVFEEDYALMPLDELEKYVTENKHLPGVPSKAEVEQHGIALTQMQYKLLEKIEELTLYIIEENKKLKAHEEILKNLEQQ